jgi:hypothetical protein
MEMLEEKYLETLGRNILLQLELNKDITALELGSYAWLVVNFVQGEQDRDSINDLEWNEGRIDIIGQNGNVGYD